jgi:FKBP-type peptidyl-prolyl cis-trans isomerase
MRGAFLISVLVLTGVAGVYSHCLGNQSVADGLAAFSFHGSGLPDRCSPFSEGAPHLCSSSEEGEKGVPALVSSLSIGQGPSSSIHFPSGGFCIQPRECSTDMRFMQHKIDPCRQLWAIWSQGFSRVKFGYFFMPFRFGRPLVKEGGKQLEMGKNVTISSTGYLKNSCTFDSSFDRKHSFPFTLLGSQVIKEWESGMATFKIGNPCPLRIPPSLSHG